MNYELVAKILDDGNRLILHLIETMQEKDAYIEKLEQQLQIKDMIDE